MTDTKKDLEFQITTWYQDDFEKREDSDDDSSSDESGSSQYKFQKNETKYTINIFGKDKFVEIINDIKSIWDKNENKISREILLKKN